MRNFCERLSLALYGASISEAIFFHNVQVAIYLVLSAIFIIKLWQIGEDLK